MKKRKISAALGAIMIAANLTACGGSDSKNDAPAAPAQTEAATEKQEEKKTEEKKETKAEETEAETTAETEPEVDNSLYDYYGKLSAEYNDNGYKGYINTKNGSYGISLLGDTIMFYDINSFEGSCYIYNISTKETKQYNTDWLPEGNFMGNPQKGDGLCCFNGELYNLTWTREKYTNIFVTDSQGNVTRQANIDIGDPEKGKYNLRFGKGYYVFYQTEDEDSIFYVITPELEVKKIPYPEVDVGHGKTEPVKVWNDSHFVNGNEIYVRDYVAPSGSDLDNDKVIFHYDGSQWNEVEINNHADHNSAQYGKYIIQNDYTIRDYDTGEEIAKFNSNYQHDFDKSYSGGDCHIMLHDGVWYKAKIPSDGSEVDWEKYEALGSEKGNTNNIAQIDDKYYVYGDDYGLFLRTYEKGDSEEETMLTFE